MMPILIAFLIILIVLILVFFTGYNRLRQMRNVVHRTFAQVDTLLQKRTDLIPALAEVAKGYAKHENQTLTNIARERAQSAFSENPAVRTEDEKTVAKDIKKILALRESYPDLKANQDFLKLMDEIEAVENEIAEYREAFNNVVKEYNNLVQTFPDSLVASLIGFAPMGYFDFGDESRAIPKFGFEASGDENLINLGPVEGG